MGLPVLETAPTFFETGGFAMNNNLKRNRMVPLLLAVLLLGTVLLALPAGPVQAQGEQPPVSGETPDTPAQHPGPGGPARLERALARQQAWLAGQSRRFELADQAATRLADLIDRLQEQGLDTTPLETALAAFQNEVAAAGTRHEDAAQILAVHAGFDAEGRLTDRDQAGATLEAAGEALDDARDGLAEAFEALREARRDFRRLHPVQSEADTQP